MYIITVIMPFIFHARFNLPLQFFLFRIWIIIDSYAWYKIIIFIFQTTRRLVVTCHNIITIIYRCILKWLNFLLNNQDNSWIQNNNNIITVMDSAATIYKSNCGLCKLIKQ